MAHIFSASHHFPKGGRQIPIWFFVHQFVQLFPSLRLAQYTQAIQQMPHPYIGRSAVVIIGVHNTITTQQQSQRQVQPHTVSVSSFYNLCASNVDNGLQNSCHK